MHFQYKLNFYDLLIFVAFYMLLAFRTGKQYDKLISTIVVFFVTLMFITLSESYLKLESSVMYYIIWYTFIVIICIASYIWADYNNIDYIKALIKDTYLPLIMIAICISIYLQLTHNSIKMLRLLIFAEAFTILRALLHTPFVEVIKTMDSRLFANGLGVNYNHFTTQMALVFVLVLYFVFYIEKSYWKVALFYFLGIFFSGSRKVILISICCFIFMYIYKDKGKNFTKQWRKIVFILILLAAGLYFVINIDFLYEFIGEKLVSVIKSFGQSSIEIRSGNSIDHSIHARAVLRESAIEQFVKSPVLGVGYYCVQFYNRYGLYSHNNFLEILASLGLVGFCAYYILYILQIYNAIKRHYYKRDTSSLNLLLIIFFAVLLFIEYGHIVFFRVYALVPMLTVIAAVHYNNKRHI